MERGDGSFTRGMILTVFILGGMPSICFPPQLKYWLDLTVPVNALTAKWHILHFVLHCQSWKGIINYTFLKYSSMDDRPLV